MMATAGGPVNLVISASAGTGKTYRLVERYISLLEAGAAPDSIIALTFTRKAAGEIFDRVIGRIAALSRGRPASGDEAAKYAVMLRKVLLNLHRLPIGTLDSFFVRILKSFPFEFGLGGDFEIIDEHMQEQAKRKVFRRILWEIGREDERAKREFLEEFKKATFGSEEKKLHGFLADFVDACHKHYLSAPEEKRWGVEKTIWPDGSAVLDCNMNPSLEAEKLAGLLEARELAGEQKAKFDEFIRLAASFREDSRLEENSIAEKLFSILPDLEKGDAVITVRKKIRLGRKECECLLKLVRHMMKCRIRAQLLITSGVYRLLKRYEAHYNELVRSGGSLTFNDIPFLLSPLGGASVLTSLKSREEDRLYIDYRLDSKFSHWLIDEFQDTSYPQWMIIKNLIDEVIQDAEERKSFFYVGDVKQAIYGWREGDASLFGAIYDEYREAGRIGLESLVKSYRSGPEVIAAVNKVFGNLGSIEDISPEVLARWKWETHSAKEKEADGRPVKGHVSLLQLPSPSESKETKKNSLEWKAEIIAGRLREISPFRRGLTAAVLVRSNDTGTEIASFLREKGIKVALDGSFRLDDNQFVSAFLSLVKFAEHPADTFSLRHLQMTPFAPFTAESEKIIAETRRDICGRGFAFLIEKWARLIQEKISFDAFTLERTAQFVAAAGLFDRTGQKNCIDFIEYIRNYPVPGESSVDAIQILTIHKAKGLQFNIVFLPELRSAKGNLLKADMSGIKVKKKSDRSTDWLIFPPVRFITEQDEILKGLVREIDSEQCYSGLCVLYVAMTRASHALYMIADHPPKNSTSLQADDILRRNLAASPAEGAYGDGEPSLLYKDGTADWFEAFAAEPEAAPEKSGTEILRVNFADALAPVSPSSAETKKFPAEIVFSGRESMAFELGTAVHELFRLLEWPEEANLELLCSEWMRKKEFPNEIAAEAERIFRSALNSPEIRKCLRRPEGNAELWRERQFDVAAGGRWISGIFDRVAVVKDSSGKITEAVLMDYKTDMIRDEAGLKRAVEGYSPQLCLYREALSALLSLEKSKIRALFLFVRKPTVSSSL